MQLGGEVVDHLLVGLHVAGTRPLRQILGDLGSRPPAIASRWWANHSYCELQSRAVIRIANSFSRGGSELRKRMYSPTFCSRSASSGRRFQTLNGLDRLVAPAPPRGCRPMRAARS